MQTKDWSAASIVRHQLSEEKPLPSIAKLMKKHEAKTVAAIELFLTAFCQMLNVGKNMDPPKIRDAAIMIASNYKTLTLEDIQACLTQAKAGAYGELYDRIDVTIIGGWLRKYTETRMEEAELFAQHKHLKSKNEHGDARLLLKGLRERYPEQYKPIAPQQTLRDKLQDPAFKAYLHEYDIEQFEKRLKQEQNAETGKDMDA